MNQTITFFGILIVLAFPGLSFGATPGQAVSSLKEALHRGVLYGMSHTGSPCTVQSIHDVDGAHSITVILSQNDGNDFFTFSLNDDPRNSISRFEANARELKVEVVRRGGTNALQRGFIRVLHGGAGTPALVSISFGAGMGSPYLSCRLR